MKKNIRWKLITSLAVFVIFFAVGVYPILAQRYHMPLPGWLGAKQLKLGLDLKGGVQLVLRVQTDEALKIHTTTTSEQLREALRTAGVTVTSISVTSPSFRRPAPANSIPKSASRSMRQGSRSSCSRCQSR